MLALVLWLQDAAALIEELRRDDLERREAATKALAEVLAKEDVAAYRLLEKVLAGEADPEVKGRLEKLTAPWRKGGVTWSRDFGTPIDQIVQADEDRVVLITRDKVAPRSYPCELRLRAVSAKTGEPLWESDMPIARNPAKGGVAGGAYVCVTGLSELSCYDLETGKRKWHTVPVKNVSEPVIDRDRIFVGGNHGVAAYDIESGKERWSVKGKGWFAAPWEIGDDLIAGSASEGVWRLSKADGTKRWVSAVKGAPVATAGELLICEVSEGITAVRQSDGTSEWRWKAGKGEGVDVAGVAGGKVIVVTSVGRIPASPTKSSLDYGDYKVRAIDAGTGKPEWMMDRGDTATSVTIAGDLVKVGDAWHRAADAEKAEGPKAAAAPPRWTALGFAFEHDEADLGVATKATVLRAVRLKGLGD